MDDFKIGDEIEVFGYICRIDDDGHAYNGGGYNCIFSISIKGIIIDVEDYTVDIVDSYVKDFNKTYRAHIKQCRKIIEDK